MPQYPVPMLCIRTDTETLRQDEVCHESDEKSASIFLGDLSRFCTKTDIEQLLSPHGFGFMDIKIMKTEEGKSHGTFEISLSVVT